MSFIQKNVKGILLCLVLAIPCWFLGQAVPVVGGPVFGILAGMLITLLLKDKTQFQSGITFVSKKVLQYAVILLGFGLNLSVILETGKQSLPIILATISTSLIIAYVLHRIMHVPGKISTLVGVGSSICGGSAIAATAPVIDADDEEVAQAISVIFFFNMLAALFFPALGALLGFSTTSGEAFGIFAGTAVNDTSSVTAAASTWDSLYQLGTQTLDKAVTVKLTRTLAIIPITLVLAFVRTRKAGSEGKKVEFKKIFPMFILYFVLASVITTIATSLGVSASVFSPLKTLSKFFIVLAMCAVGLNTNIVKLIKTGGKPLALGFCCWVGIACVSLLMQHLLKKTQDKKTRAYLINYFLEQFRTTLYRQTMFAEFELKINELVQNGGSLTAEGLNKIYHDLNVFYYGDAVVVDDLIDREWARIPHFYYNYYVFQYSTGFSAAMALSERILSEGEPAVKDYLNFLSGGCSKDPISLLQGAGVDMRTAEPVHRALKLFDSLLDEMEALMEA